MASPPKVPTVASVALVSVGDGSSASNSTNDNTLSTLETQVRLFEDLHSRLQKLKDAPTRLLASALPQLNSASALTVPSLGTDVSMSASSAFEELRVIQNLLRDDKIQSALLSSKAKTYESIGQSIASLKRKRDPNEATVTPIRPVHRPAESPARASINDLPPESPTRLRLSRANLPAFIREHNKTGVAPRLHIWASKADSGRSSSVVVRMLVADVLVAFLTFEDGDAELIVETASVFGPREQKPIHSQSEYSVYRKMNQNIIRLVRQAGDVSLQRIIVLIQAYAGIFEAHCTGCKRVVSETDHNPAVEISFSEKGPVFRHTTC